MKATILDVIDHINGNSLDNQRSNLRFCTMEDNLKNKNKYKTYKGKPTSSKHRGVFFNKRLKKWIASVGGHKTNVYLGVFKTEEEAAAVAKIEIKRRYGNFYYE